MQSYNTKEIINKLIGQIRPVGETNTDVQRFENLKEMCQLVNELVSEIDSVSYDFRDNYEHSVKKASEYAKHFLTEELGIN